MFKAQFNNTSLLVQNLKIMVSHSYMCCICWCFYMFDEIDANVYFMYIFFIYIYILKTKNMPFQNGGLFYFSQLFCFQAKLIWPTTSARCMCGPNDLSQSRLLLVFFTSQVYLVDSLCLIINCQKHFYDNFWGRHCHHQKQIFCTARRGQTVTFRL